MIEDQGVDLSNFTMNAKGGEVFDSEEAAQFLRISVASLRNMASNGVIPYYKLGRRNRYLKKDLVDLLTANRRGGWFGNK